MTRNARMRMPAGLLGLALTISGCAGMNPFGETEKYGVMLSATGTVPITATSLGNIDVPTNGIGLLNLAVTLAGQHLAQQQNLKSCVFQSYPPTLDAGTITVTASAVCKFQGQAVNETVSLALTPVAA